MNNLIAIHVHTMHVYLALCSTINTIHELQDLFTLMAVTEACLAILKEDLDLREDFFVDADVLRECVWLPLMSHQGRTFTSSYFK